MFLLKDTKQWHRWGLNPRPLSLESSTLPLSHCAPQYARQVSCMCWCMMRSRGGYSRYWLGLSGGGGGGGGNYIYMTLYECACQRAPFFSAARYTISRLFLRKSIWLTQSFIIDIWMVPFSDIPVWKYSYFCSDIQFRNQNCNIYL